MAKDDGMGEKTEQATPKRREEARERGQVAKSQDLASSVLMLVGFSTLKFLGGWFGPQILGMIRFPLENLDADPGTLQSAVAGSTMGAAQALIILAPLLAILMIASLGIMVMQVGFHITPQAFELNWDKMNPITGVGRLFSLRALVKLATGIAKIVLVSSVLFIVIQYEMPRVMALMGYFDFRNNNSGVIVSYLLEMICNLGIYAGATLTVLSIIDFAYQKWQHSQDLMMSKQEVKDEMKNMEGDPHIKRRRLERARAMAQRRMVKNVPEADVVVTNPTHFSVALRFKPEDPAPRVVAKGADLLALEIREIASKHKVPIVEKPELARALYRWVDVDEMIPDRFWTPVAEVLAYVYEIDKRRRDRAMGDGTGKAGALSGATKQERP